METKHFLKALDDDAIARAIAAVEKRTSGEIRVFVSDKIVEDVVKEAQDQFVKLGMAKTELRNGVLIYFSPKAQKFAVIGDQSIHEKCGQKFWEGIAGQMVPVLQGERFTEAIIQSINELGEVLAREFPWRPGDRNELPNTVVREKPNV